MVGTLFPKLQNGRCLHTTQEYLHKIVQIIIPYINKFWNPGFICNDKNTAIISNTHKWFSDKWCSKTYCNRKIQGSLSEVNDFYLENLRQ